MTQCLCRFHWCRTQPEAFDGVQDLFPDAGFIQPGIGQNLRPAGMFYETVGQADLCKGQHKPILAHPFTHRSAGALR